MVSFFFSDTLTARHERPDNFDQTVAKSVGLQRKVKLWNHSLALELESSLPKLWHKGTRKIRMYAMLRVSRKNLLHPLSVRSLPYDRIPSVPAHRPPTPN